MDKMKDFEMKIAEATYQVQLEDIKKTLGDIFAGLHKQALKVEEALKNIDQNPGRAIEVAEQIANDIMWVIPNLGIQSLIGKAARLKEAEILKANASK